MLLNYYFIAFYLKIIFVNGFGLDLKTDPSGPVVVDTPYGSSCPIESLSGSKLYSSQQPLRDGSQLAFYPMTDQNKMLYLSLTTELLSFRVITEGTMITLKRCNKLGRGCTVINEAGVKTTDYIKAQDWNYVSVKLTSDELAISIGTRMVKAMNIKQYDMSSAQWYVEVKPAAYANKSPTNTIYLVQHRCNDVKMIYETKEPHTTPQSDDALEDIHTPSAFKGCPLQNLANSMQKTSDEPLENGSELAFFPMMEQNTMLYLVITTDELSYQVTIEDMMFRLEKCDAFRNGCQVIDEAEVKTEKYVSANAWNFVTVTLTYDELTISIDKKMVKAMALNTIDMRDAKWSVEIKPEEYTKNSSPSNNKHYLVQFKCRAYSPRATDYSTTAESIDNSTYVDPSHHIGETTTDHPSTKHDSRQGKPYVGLIVGLVCGVIIIAAVIVILYKVVKKRKSLDITESSPMHNRNEAVK